MKKIVLFIVPALLAISTTSCNDRLEGDEIVNTESLKIDSVKILQDTMFVMNTQVIKTYSNYTAKCEGFYGYDYLHTDEFDRKVFAYRFKTTANCGDLVTRSSQINFKPQKVGVYHFKFYNGKGPVDQDLYIEKTIVVK